MNTIKILSERDKIVRIYLLKKPPNSGNYFNFIINILFILVAHYISSFLADARVTRNI